MKDKFTILDLKKIIDLKFSDYLKPFVVDLVWMGFLNYKKLTIENYDFWWYEVEDKTKINKKAFTFNFQDIEISIKGKKYLKLFIDIYDDEESAYYYISCLLNYIVADQENTKENEIYDRDRLKELYFNRNFQQNLFA